MSQRNRSNRQDAIAKLLELEDSVIRGSTLKNSKTEDKNEETMGTSPLHLACAGGHTQVAILLLENGADITGYSEEKSPLYLAVKYGHANTAAALVARLIARGANKETDPEPYEMMLNEAEKFATALLISNPQYFTIIDSKLSPLALYRSVKRQLVELLQSLLQSQSPFVFQFLVTVRMALYNVSLSQSTEGEAIDEEVMKVDAVIGALLQVPSINDHQFKILLPGSALGGESAQPAMAFDPSLDGKSTRDRFDDWFKIQNLKSIQCMEALNRKNPLGMCLQSEIKTPFGLAFVLEDVLVTFWGVIVHTPQLLKGQYLLQYPGLMLFGILGIPRYDDFKSVLFQEANADGLGSSERSNLVSKKLPQDDEDGDEGKEASAPIPNPSYEYMMTRCSLKAVLVNWWNPRACPAIMFFTEGLAKAIMLALVGYIAVHEYGHLGQRGYNGTKAQNGLILMITTSLMYEVGQFLDYEEPTLGEKLNVIAHDLWGILDLSAYFLVLLWMLMMGSSDQATKSAIVLSLSTIPLALCMFQYLSVAKSLGRLVIMLRAMMVDIVDFAWMFLVCVLGFGLSLWGLFNSSGFDGFGSAGFTFLQLFSVLLGGLAYTPFFPTTAEEYSIAVAGAVVYVMFAVLVTILLINLLIARMSGTHNRIDAMSLAEYGFMMGQITTSYRLLEEKNPMWMLPPPLNIIPAALLVPHYFCMHYCGLSLAGTASNFTLRLVGAIPRTIAWALLPWFYLIWGDTKPYVGRAFYNAIFRIIGLLGIPFMPVTLLMNVILALIPFDDVTIVCVTRVDGEEEGIVLQEGRKVYKKDRHGKPKEVGRITRIHPDKSFDILYHDGEKGTGFKSIPILETGDASSPKCAGPGGGLCPTRTSSQKASSGSSGSGGGSSPVEVKVYVKRGARSSGSDVLGWFRGRYHLVYSNEKAAAAAAAAAAAVTLNPQDAANAPSVKNPTTGDTATAAAPASAKAIDNAAATAPTALLSRPTLWSDDDIDGLFDPMMPPTNPDLEGLLQTLMEQSTQQQERLEQLTALVNMLAEGAGYNPVPHPNPTFNPQHAAPVIDSNSISSISSGVSQEILPEVKDFLAAQLTKVERHLERSLEQHLLRIEERLEQPQAVRESQGGGGSRGSRRRSDEDYHYGDDSAAVRIPRGK